jgi:signal peptidase I
MDTDTKGSGFTRWFRILIFGRNPKFTLVRILVLIAIVLIAREYVLIPIRIEGPSMMPTYQESGVNFVNRLAYRRSEPKRGDVVAIRYAGNHLLLMKRVLALPGETIEFRNGQVFINGEILPEPYMVPTYPSNWTLPPKTIQSNSYYVVGDNRTMPEQLHTKGEAKRERIVGKILLCKNLFASFLPRR